MKKHIFFSIISVKLKQSISLSNIDIARCRLLAWVGGGRDKQIFSEAHLQDLFHLYLQTQTDKKEIKVYVG